MADVVRHYRSLAAESGSGTGPDGGFVYDTVVVGGGAAGAGVLRDLASRRGASALLADRGPFGAQTSSKTGKAIHPGIRYLRMAFHRLLLASGLRTDPGIRQTRAQNAIGAWLDLKLVWYGTRERRILLDTSGRTVEEIPNVVFVLPDSPERKWAVFFGISLYDLFTAVWSWARLNPRGSRVKYFPDNGSLHRELGNLDAERALGGILYWDGKASTDKTLIVTAIRDACFRSSAAEPVRALSHVEVEHYEWSPAQDCFLVTLARRFEHPALPERVTVRARTITNAAGPWVDRVRDRGPGTGGEETTVVYSRGTHLEATNRFIHESLEKDPRLRVGLVPLNAVRQHYLRPFKQNGLWYIQCTTTDREHTDPDCVVPEEDEIEELLHSYNELVDDRWKIGRRDIFNVFCGIRPLAASGSGIGVQDISRMFRINERRVGGGTVYDMVNVKLTEFRWAGSEVGARIARELRRTGVKRLGRSTTRRSAVLPVPDEERYAPNRDDHPRGDPDHVRAKVEHHVTYQMAGSYEDYLLNSGGIRDAVVFDAEGRCDLDLAVLDLVLERMAELLGWDRRRTRREWDAFAEAYLRNMAYADLGRRVREHVPATQARTAD
ncbi:FAD-dependent oxidoreductase [Nocardiopsis rhodophaea]